MATSNGFWKRFFNLIAFCALVLCGVALLISLIFSKNTISGPLRMVAEILAYIVVIFYSFMYAWSRGSSRDGRHTRRQIVYVVIWAVAAILVVTCVILGYSLNLW